MIGGYFVGQTYIGDYYPTYGVAWTVSVSDTLTIIESPSKSVGKASTETIKLTDSLSRVVEYIQSLTDTATLSDAIVKASGMYFIDTPLITDTISKSIGISQSETTTLNDSLIPERGFLRSFTDTVIFSDVVTAGLQRLISINDSVTITDNLLGFNFGVGINETVILKDYPWVKFTEAPDAWSKDTDPTTTWTKESDAGGVWTEQNQDEGRR